MLKVAMDKFLMCGEVALRVRGRVQPHHVVRWCDKNLIPFTKAGRIRLIAERDLDAVRAVARQHGLLDDEPASEAKS